MSLDLDLGGKFNFAKSSLSLLKLYYPSLGLEASALLDLGVLRSSLVLTKLAVPSLLNNPGEIKKRLFTGFFMINMLRLRPNPWLKVLALMEGGRRRLKAV